MSIVEKLMTKVALTVAASYPVWRQLVGPFKTWSVGGIQIKRERQKEGEREMERETEKAEKLERRRRVGISFLVMSK